MRRLISASVLIILFLVSQPASSEDMLVGVEKIDYYHFYAMKKGRYIGFAADLFSLYGESSGVKIIPRPSPVAKLTSNFVDGKVAFKFPDNPYWGKDAKKGIDVKYSVPVVSYIDGMMVLSANKGKGIASIKKVGTIRGFTPFDILDNIKRGEIDLKEYSHTKTMIKKLAGGEVDAIYFNIQVATFILNMMDENYDIVFDSDLPHVEAHYYLSTIKKTAELESFNEFMLKNSSAINELKAKYGL